MSAIADAFVAAMGKPNPPSTPGLHFADERMQASWDRIQAEVGAGWFLNHFLCLFAEGLDSLGACLDAWSFLVPPSSSERLIAGRNAYGAILVVENSTKDLGGLGEVHVLDPTAVAYWSHPDLYLRSMIGSWLPHNEIPHFLEHELYDAWLQQSGRYLVDDEILAMRAPRGLGGAMTLDNFYPENIFSYYETTGPIYAKAFPRKEG